MLQQRPGSTSDTAVQVKFCARRGLIAGYAIAGQTLHLHASDEPSLGEAAEWFVERGAEGATWQHCHGTTDVTVRGPATTLLLVLTRRRSISDGLDGSLQASGDLDLFTHWIANTAHPAG